ncbi:RXLR effector family, putative [Phytophthora infestans T30-4]|uniref:RXLR effector family, putative n=1 Tax=Phytophthora infestans (strain T30-4) TaxID=403677 RepID=D0NRQ8_PHYIT|nr:RXLR effector family, putative [Phytophthora infestans T30-4]EEY63408.1 RXLR effector family, putative [Phytophthora infestans T30-4]|eukprot:XP_002898293.1 RXLR effector family, putative [Phytophthora infestans T30-4]
MTSNLKSLVQQLKSEQRMVWITQGRSVDDVFNLLKLNDDGLNVLRSRKFEVLEDYVTKLNHGQSVDETLVKVLTKHMDGEDNLVRLLDQAKWSTRSLDKANHLETALLTKWQNEKLLPMSVWSRLKFSDNVDDALDSRKLNMFSNYISKYFPDNEMSVLERFTAKYGEVSAAKALITAKRKTATQEFATKLQAQQLEGWMAKIKDDGVKAMKSRKLDVLSEYITLSNANKRPQDKTHLFRVVRKGFGDGDLARVLATAQATTDPQVIANANKYQNQLFKRWFQGSVEPKDVYTTFLSGKTGGLETVIATRYADFYHKRQPKVHIFNDPRRF